MTDERHRHFNKLKQKYSNQPKNNVKTNVHFLFTLNTVITILRHIEANSGGFLSFNLFSDKVFTNRTSILGNTAGIVSSQISQLR